MRQDNTGRADDERSLHDGTDADMHAVDITGLDHLVDQAVAAVHEKNMHGLNRSVSDFMREIVKRQRKIADQRTLGERHAQRMAQQFARQADLAGRDLVESKRF